MYSIEIELYDTNETKTITWDSLVEVADDMVNISSKCCNLDILESDTCRKLCKKYPEILHMLDFTYVRKEEKYGGFQSVIWNWNYKTTQ